ncbi:MAG: hypothetical protein JJT78_03810 [Leptospira sp.]|nr:hypothetical protein [Leptospira sp.]
MPAKIYRFNSWFEAELSSLVKTGQLPTLNRQKLNRNAFLERLFLALSLPDDIVLVSEPVPVKLLQHWKDKNWIHTNRIINTKLIPENERILNEVDTSQSELIEFGGVRSITNSGIEADASIWEASAFWNSRVNQWNFSMEESLDDFIEGGKISLLEDMEIRTIQSVDDLQDILSNKMDSTDSMDSAELKPFLFKAEYSSSGRGHVLWRGARDNHRLSKLEFPVVMETFHENRKHDFGVLLEFTSPEMNSVSSHNTLLELEFQSTLSNSSVKLLGISEMVIGKDFQFKGCTFYNANSPEWLQNVRELFTKNPGVLKNWENFRYNTGDSTDYTGPASWDGYLLETGEIRLRSEINFRMSLGRIAWEIHEKRKKLSENHGELLGSCDRFGILILHSKEKIDFSVQYELTLTISESEPWRVVYWEG